MGAVISRKKPREMENTGVEANGALARRQEALDPSVQTVNDIHFFQSDIPHRSSSSDDSVSSLSSGSETDWEEANAFSKASQFSAWEVGSSSTNKGNFTSPAAASSHPYTESDGHIALGGAPRVEGGACLPVIPPEGQGAEDTKMMEFLVSISAIRISGLSLVGDYHLRLDWGESQDQEHKYQTKVCTQTDQPEWPEVVSRFRWTTGTLQNKNFVLKVMRTEYTNEDADEEEGVAVNRRLSTASSSVSIIAPSDTSEQQGSKEGGRRKRRIRTTVASCSIAIGDIATGPVHHDWAMKVKSAVSEENIGQCRVQMNISVEQMCDMQIYPIACLFEQNSNINFVISGPNPDIISEDQENPFVASHHYVAGTGLPLAYPFPPLEDPSDVGPGLPSSLDPAVIGTHDRADLQSFEWKVAFVMNHGTRSKETSFPASWSEMCTDPLWDAVNTTKLAKVLRDVLNEDQCITGKPGMTRAESGAADMGQITRMISEKLRETNEIISSSSITSSASKHAVNGDDISDMMDLAKRLAEDEQASERDDRSNNTERAPELGSTLRESLRDLVTSDDIQQAALGLLSQHHLERLGQLSRKGYSIAPVLDQDVLPIIKLRTTLENLNRHHIRIVAHCRDRTKTSSGDAISGGIKTERIFGETWVPFSKIVKASVTRRHTLVPSSSSASLSGVRRSSVHLVDTMAEAPEGTCLDDQLTDRHHFQASVFKGDLHHAGHIVGSVACVFVFQNNPVLSQLAAGVRTERGIQRVSPIILGEISRLVDFDNLMYFDNDHANGNRIISDLPSQVRRIALNHKRLLELMFEAPQVRTTATATPVETLNRSAVRDLGKKLGNATKGATTAAGGGISRQRILEEIQRDLKACRSDAFNSSSSPDDNNDVAVAESRSFVYPSEDSLLMAQHVFVNLSNHILEHVEKLPWEIQQSYYAVLQLIFRRQEMDFPMLLPESLLLSATGQADPKALSQTSAELRYLCSAISKARAISVNNEQTNGTLVHRESLKSTRNAQRLEASDIALLKDLAKRCEEEYPRLHSALCESVELGVEMSKIVGANSTANTTGEAENNMIGEYRRKRKNKGNGDSVSQNGIIDRILTCTCRSASPPPPNNSKSKFVPRSRLLTPEEARSVLLVHRKMRTCRQVWLLLHKLLEHTLSWMNQKVEPNVDVRKYLTIFMAILYFRVPKFGFELLSAILPPKDQNQHISAEEWRGTAFDIDAVSLRMNQTWYPVCDFKLVLDWSSFHELVDNYWGRESLLHDLHIQQQRTGQRSSFEDSRWRRLIGLRTRCFHSFLINWTKNVRQTLGGVAVPQAIHWHTIPGYIWMVKAVVLDIQRYSPTLTGLPDGLVSACGALLAVNPRLLSAFIKACWLRTNVYVQSSVYDALTYVDFWLTVVRQWNVGYALNENAPEAQQSGSSSRMSPLMKRKLILLQTVHFAVLPDNFDHRFTLIGIRRILVQSDLVSTKAQCLWLLYRNLQSFGGLHREAIVSGILLHPKYGPCLFLHWSPLVRKLYQLVLLFQVVHAHKITQEVCPPLLRSSLQDDFGIVEDCQQDIPQYSNVIALVESCLGSTTSQKMIERLGAPITDCPPTRNYDVEKHLKAYVQYANAEFNQVLKSYAIWFDIVTRSSQRTCCSGVGKCPRPEACECLPERPVVNVPRSFETAYHEPELERRV